MAIINQIISTIQGEGRNIGAPSLLIRFCGCNLSCDFCDTKWSTTPSDDSFSIDSEEDIKNNIPSNIPMFKNIMITGGEPLLSTNINAIHNIIKYAEYMNVRTIEIESNGTTHHSVIEPILNNINRSSEISFNISPKLDPKAYPSKDINNIYDIIKIHYYNNMEACRDYNFVYVNYKFVYSEKYKYDILSFISALSLQTEEIIIMPLTPQKNETNFYEKYKNSCIDTIQFCKQHGFRYSPREHIWLFSDVNENTNIK